MQLEIQESGYCGRHTNNEERDSGKKTTHSYKGKENLHEKGRHREKEREESCGQESNARQGTWLVTWTSVEAAVGVPPAKGKLAGAGNITASRQLTAGIKAG